MDRTPEAHVDGHTARSTPVIPLQPSPDGRRPRLRRAVLALALLAIASAAGADTYPRQPGIRITHYAFHYVLSDASPELMVDEHVDVQFVADGVTTVALDLCGFSARPRSPQRADGSGDPCAESPSEGAGRTTAPSGGTGMTVTDVRAGTNPLRWVHADDRLVVTLPRAFAAGERFTFSVSFKGVPATGLLIGPNRHGDRSWVTNAWPDKARNFRAVVDHPSMKATHTTTVTAPRAYQVVSNGVLAEQTDLPNGLRRTVWRQGMPISTWLMSLAVAPFAVDHFGSYRGIPLSSWVYPQEHEAGLRAFATHTQPVLEFYADRIGPYPYEKLAQVQANGVSGGMELASSIFYGYGTSGAGRQLIAHEMAHQYFGDAVTEADWDDVWLSEGFATYVALLYTEFADGHDAFLDGVRRSKAQALAFALAHPDSTIVHRNLSDVSRVIANGAQVYQGGAQVLHNVRGVLGTDTFWAGIRAYYARYQHGTATTADFRRVMEEACQSAGERCPAAGKDLAWLFGPLLTRGGALQVQGTWRYDAGARQVTVTLRQTQTTGLYRMPIELRLVTTRPSVVVGRASAAGAAATETARATHVVDLRDAVQVFTLPSETEPTSVELDPDAWVLMQASMVKQ